MCIESQGRMVLCGSENNKEAKWLQRSEREERGSKLRSEGVAKHSYPTLGASKDVGTHREITSSLCRSHEVRGSGEEWLKYGCIPKI